MSQIENRTGTLIRDVARLHLRLQRETTACCGGTTMTQCTILTEIGRNGSGTLIELTNRLVLDKSWLSRGETPLVLEAGSEVGANIRQWGMCGYFHPGGLTLTRLPFLFANTLSGSFASFWKLNRWSGGFCGYFWNWIRGNYSGQGRINSRFLWPRQLREH